MATISAILHGALTPHQILWEMDLADGERLENTWWLTDARANPDGKNRLRRTRPVKPLDLSEVMRPRK